MNDNKYYVPRTLDSPAKVIFWEVDEVILFVACFLLGIISGYVFTGLIIGAILMIIYSKLKNNRGAAYVKQSAYWFLPSNLFFKLYKTPPSHIREFVG